MSDYQQDIFYLSCRDLTPDIWEKMCREALTKCYKWWIETIYLIGPEKE